MRPRPVFSLSNDHVAVVRRNNEPLSVLVADDDPGSCRFFCDALDALGARTQACTNGINALALAQSRQFDLLLLDCRMPGAGAAEILARLRADETALSRHSLAMATTAELSPAGRQLLLDAGFSDVLMKPCTLADLKRVLSQPELEGTVVLDDGAALITTGDTTTMRALRLLLREELDLLQHELDTLNNDRIGFSERLHRLRSSCGFCGAATLSAQTVLLQRQLEQAQAEPVSLVRFRHALLATIHALDQ